ncbi:hypothetical protein BFF94_002725 [Burkholderia catarinensis]|nr:hypothetical protein BFF94_002725 [Burkholderia catarinensis]
MRREGVIHPSPPRSPRQRIRLRIREARELAALRISVHLRAVRPVAVSDQRLARYTQNTISDPELLEAELDRTAHKGVLIDNEEFVAGIVCIAAPIAGDNGACIAAVARTHRHDARW